MDRKKAQQNVFVLKPKWNSVDCDVCSKPFPFSGLFTGKTDSDMVSPTWGKMQSNGNCAHIHCMFLPEFSNPFAFVSSHAWLMNSLHSKHNLNWSQGIQLLHLALLTPSQARFHLALKAVMRGYKQNTNLHFAFMQFCSKNKLPTHGGIGPESDCELEDNLKNWS